MAMQNKFNSKINMEIQYNQNAISKQETHGPNRSPENQFQSINTFAHDMIKPQC